MNVKVPTELPGFGGRLVFNDTTSLTLSQDLTPCCQSVNLMGLQMSADSISIVDFNTWNQTLTTSLSCFIQNLFPDHIFYLKFDIFSSPHAPVKFYSHVTL